MIYSPEKYDKCHKRWLRPTEGIKSLSALLRRLLIKKVVDCFFVTRSKSNLDARRVSSAPTDVPGYHMRPEHLPERLLQLGAYPEHLLATYPFQGYREQQYADVTDQPGRFAGAYHLRTLQKPLAGRAALRVNQAASSHQTLLRYLGERGQDPNLDRRVHICAHWTSMM